MPSAPHLFDKEPVNVVAVGVEQQEQNDDQSDILRRFEHLVAHLAARDHLPESEDRVPAVESRDRQNVHHREDDRQEGGLHPEVLPVPRGGEDAADGDESAQLLVHLGFGLHDHLQLVPVGGDHLARPLNTGRNRLQERIFLRAQREALADDSERAVLRDGRFEFKEHVPFPQDCQQHRISGVRLQVLAVARKVETRNVVDGYDLVSLPQLCDGRVYDAVDQKGDAGQEEMYLHF